MPLPPLSRELWDECCAAGFQSNGSTMSPDTVLDVAIANGDNRWPPLPADLHDLRYFMGGSDRDRLDADAEFLAGLYACVDSFGGMMREVARRRCRTYYRAVRKFGGKFWNLRDEPTIPKGE